MLIQEVLTDLAPEEIIPRAKVFFATRFSPYPGFVDSESATHLHMRTENGTIAIGAGQSERGTWVRASSTRQHHEVSQFLTTIARPETVRQNKIGPATSGAG
ncbi:MAG TPA: hypothetical protein VFX29_04890 [Longimicrobiaceae bacterium]|jgi:hypothetical protein|nr:hypothetical protein [Longimicrobiaceae bacterium]